MKIIWYIIPVFLVLSISGCLDLFGDMFTTEVIYEDRPIEIAYHISYGYNVHCIGDGFHQIEYLLDLPDVLGGNMTVTEVLMENKSKMVSHANNSMVYWNITGRYTSDYKLGVSAFITARSFLIEDLEGLNADTIENINLYHPSLVKKYTHSQGNETKTYIDPYDPSIKYTAKSVMKDTENAFLVAKKLFIWLKTYTTYKPHIGSKEVQPASDTFIKKTGDCDDLTFLYLSLCRAVNLPARFIKGYLLKEDRGKIECIPHVWAEVFVGGTLGWIPVECAGDGEPETEVDQDFGVEDAFHLRLFMDDGSNESIRITFSNLIVKYDNIVEVEMQPYVKVDNYNVLESKELVVKNSMRSYR